MSDHTYLSLLGVADLLTHTRLQVNDLAPSVKDHAIRALADRLELYVDAYATIDALTDQLNDAERRADSWRAEAQAVQRQLDQARG
jgi:hypothetical protein